MEYPGSSLDDIEVGGNFGSTNQNTNTFAEPTAPTNYNTLDEPFWETLSRDLKQIAFKAGYVMIPRNSDGMTELRNWDLWGPLVFCMLLACTLAIAAAEDQKAIVFAAVFVIVWLGAAVVTLNGILLGGTVSFFQTVCVFGYCLFPLNLASICALFWDNFIFKTLVAVAATVWASRAAVGFMAQLVPQKRKVMAVYPVMLFYIVFGWMIMLQ